MAFRSNCSDSSRCSLLAIDRSALMVAWPVAVVVVARGLAEGVADAISGSVHIG